MLALLLVILPMLLAAAVLVLGAKAARFVSLAGSLAGLLLTLFAIERYRSGLQALLDFRQQWIPSLGINFHLHLDGINLVLLLLSAVVAPLIILSSNRQGVQKPHVLYALVLLMIGGMNGCFAAGDALVFYLFYEFALLPIFFIAYLWGTGDNRAAITLKFFLYTLFGSLFMLVSLLYVYRHTAPHSFEFEAMYAAGRSLGAAEQGLVMFGLFVAFAVKMPVFPFHTWQPATYQMTPTIGTMLLASLMLKMATYGLVRLVLPMVPDGLEHYGYIPIALSVVSVIYASLMALVQKRYKLLIAYSSIAHVGIISAGVLSSNETAVQGGLVEMFSHGILAIGLFFVYDVITSRLRTDDMGEMGGIREENPVLAYLFFVIVMGSVALPFTSGFVGEFLLLAGLFQGHELMAALAGLSVILGAVYMLRAFQRMFLGTPVSLVKGFATLSQTELWILALVVALVIFIGVYPQPLLDLSGQAVNELLNR